MKAKNINRIEFSDNRGFNQPSDYLQEWLNDNPEADVLNISSSIMNDNRECIIVYYDKETIYYDKETIG